MTPLDYVITVFYFLVIVGIGTLFRNQKSLKDYFLGGQQVPWWAAMFSGIATLVSAVGYLGAPGVAFSGDFTLHQYRLGLPTAIFVLCVVMLPFFYSKQRFSIYSYFEERFDLPTRLVASGLFVVLKTCYVGLAIYAPALVIKQLFGISIWYIIGFIGLLTTFYTLVGGMRAVIWTDTVQLFVLFGGLFVVAAILFSRIDGGLPQVIAVGIEHDKFRFFDFSFDLTTRYTVWSGLIGGTIFLLTQYGADQAEIQRFLATKSLRHANVALIGTLVVTFAFGLFVFFIGTSLFAFYSEFPEKGGLSIASNDVFPKFIVEELPSGVKGLLVGSVLAAAMSTVSSVLNSVTTVTVSDFYNRFAAKEASVMLARTVTLVFGVVAVLVAGMAGALGNILELAMAMNSFFGGPLLGLFLLGMLSKRAHAKPAFAALWIGMGVAVLVGTTTEISFLWYGAFSSGTTMVAGWLLSWIIPARREA